MRKYHIIATNIKTGYKDYMTRYAMSYDECCIMYGKLSKYKYIKYDIEQVLPTLD